MSDDKHKNEGIDAGLIRSLADILNETDLTEIEVELQQFAAYYRSRGWVEAIGSSGTARAIEAICVANGWSEVGVTPEALIQLRTAILAAGSVEKLDMPGLSDDRVSLIAGGAVILQAAFSALGITRMTVCETAMREGLLYDMLGRASDRDPRAASIRSVEMLLYVYCVV